MKIKNILYYLFIYPIYKLQFGSMGRRTRVVNPLKLSGRKNIHLGDRVIVGYKGWLAASADTNAEKLKLSIGNGTQIGHFCHIYCTKEITIGAHVLMADRVYVSDNLHTYTDIERPILSQPIKQLAGVHIGDGSWVGENACIIGASIGKHCVIGANAVVTKDIPDYCVVVGIPAKIIKRYDTLRKTWVRTHSNGDFMDEDSDIHHA